MGLPRTGSSPRQVGENLARSPQSCRRHRRHSNETVHRRLLQGLHRPNGQPRHADRQTTATPPPTALPTSDHRTLPLASTQRPAAHPPTPRAFASCPPTPPPRRPPPPPPHHPDP